jgi:MGT family glycosyltransferase
MVCDNESFVGHIAARLERTPVVGIGTNLLSLGDGPVDYRFSRMAKALDAERAALFARHGLKASFGLFEVHSDLLNLVLAPKGLVEGWRRPPNVEVVGASLALEARGDEPVDFPWALVASAKPVVYVAMGSLFGRHRPEIIPIVARAAAPLGVQLIIASDAADRLAQAGFPGDIIFTRYAPQLGVLAKASVFVSHGGLNSVVESLYHGVPMLLLPIFAEQPLNAHLMEARGAGIFVEPDDLSVSRCRSALTTLLTASSHRESALRLSSEIRQEDGAAAAATQISGLLASMR